MELRFAHVEELEAGLYSGAVHTTANKVNLFYVGPDSKLYFKEAETPLGIWHDLVWSEPINASPEDNHRYLKIKYLAGDFSWYTWLTDDEHLIAVDPPGESSYGPDDLYRIYYAHDSNKVYMNVGQRWRFIASLRHGLLTERNEDQHPQYLNEARHNAVSHPGQMQKQIDDDLPDATEAQRGQIFTLKGAAGVGDQVYICIKDEDDNYYWKEVTFI